MFSHLSLHIICLFIRSVIFSVFVWFRLDLVFFCCYCVLFVLDLVRSVLILLDPVVVVYFIQIWTIFVCFWLFLAAICFIVLDLDCFCLLLSFLVAICLYLVRFCGRGLIDIDLDCFCLFLLFSLVFFWLFFFSAFTHCLFWLNRFGQTLVAVRLSWCRSRVW